MVKKRNHTRTNITREKRLEVLYLDIVTYKKVFDSKPNCCEECGADLPEEFLDENGNVSAIWQYSHILGKAAWPMFRHNHINFNRLCFKDHEKWEFGDRKSMKIYESNNVIINNLLNGHTS